MKAGDIISEERGHQYELKSLLGQGLWAKTFLAQSKEGVDWVLKIPLSASDFPSGHEEKSEICRKIALHYGEMFSKLKTQEIMCPSKTFISTTDVPILVFKYNRNNLEQRLRQKISFQELLGLCIRIVDALDALPLPLKSHGNLHPRNIFLMERDRILLADPLTPFICEHYPQLSTFRRQIDSCFPPEIQNKKTNSPAEVTIDTYCVAAILFRGITKGKRLSLKQGISKDIRVIVHESLIDILLREQTNKIFHERLCTQLIQFLNRALSAETSPSPPYRFSSLSKFQTRLGNIYDLIEPSVTYIGQIILERSPGDIAFKTYEPIQFSCTIECTPKLDDIDEIDCGVRLVDRTRNERIRGYELGYSVHSHPSGRLRFDFSLGTLAAAQYTVKIAFKIRGSSAEVRTQEKDFDVEPEAGWVPPKEERRSPPIILTPDTSQLQVLIDPAQDDESSDITEDISESVVEAPPLSLVSNSDPESFFPSEERIDNDSWTPEAPKALLIDPTVVKPIEPQKIKPSQEEQKKEDPKLIIKPISPQHEPSSYDEPSYTFSVQNIHDIEVKGSQYHNDSSEQDDEDSAIPNPFGTTWEKSHPRISEDTPEGLWELSESQEEGDFVDQIKHKILNIRHEPYYFFVTISVCIIILLIIITITI